MQLLARHDALGHVPLEIQAAAASQMIATFVLLNDGRAAGATLPMAAARRALQSSPGAAVLRESQGGWGHWRLGPRRLVRGDPDEGHSTGFLAVHADRQELLELQPLPAQGAPRPALGGHAGSHASQQTRRAKAMAAMQQDAPCAPVVSGTKADRAIRSVGDGQPNCQRHDRLRCRAAQAANACGAASIITAAAAGHQDFVVRAGSTAARRILRCAAEPQIPGSENPRQVHVDAAGYR
mmetsp:Transcript_18119/g.51668  ORF Transcript_18119/g.51668 Transcript_18119/m.51668 type:complete len:238 (+) Transcript_18119:563-1276(+)